MDFSLFATAVGRDPRNRFEKYDGNLDPVPDEFKTFYREHNPIDVELDSDYGDMRFYPAGSLPDLQAEYSYINANFIFATSNGDPIFFHEGQVYTCLHGVNEPRWELLADGVDEFFAMLSNYV